MKEAEESGFTVLENKNIGRNLATFRKLRDKKALEVAEYLGVKEATYTKYERGESKITIELIQKVAEFLKVDPLQIVSAHPGHVIEHLTSSNVAIQTNSTFQTYSEKQQDMMLQLISEVLELNKALKKVLEGKK
ncbi:helix-turn-helix domain-containing protein [Negadavirga shengliensis]|uniref:Helix-turn-helix domain-containing protein n=1 Tax=Negadavirga shengliensis TaxID=1389218 RepID=A0ABV9T8D9_9BACT